MLSCSGSGSGIDGVVSGTAKGAFIGGIGGIGFSSISRKLGNSIASSLLYGAFCSSSRKSNFGISSFGAEIFSSPKSGKSGSSGILSSNPPNAGGAGGKSNSSKVSFFSLFKNFKNPTCTHPVIYINPFLLKFLLALINSKEYKHNYTRHEFHQNAEASKWKIGICPYFCDVIGSCFFCPAAIMRLQS